MKFLKELIDLVESPQMAKDTSFNWNDESYNKKKALEVYKNNKPLGIVGDFLYYLIEANLYFIDPTTLRIVYNSELEKYHHPLLNREVVQQSAVWRDTNIPYTKEILNWVFWDMYVDVMGGIITDKLQTSKGKHFWIANIKKALSRASTYAYYVSAHPKNNIIEITSIEMFNDLIQKENIWTYDNNGRERLLYITSNSINK